MEESNTHGHARLLRLMPEKLNCETQLITVINDSDKILDNGGKVDFHFGL